MPFQTTLTAHSTNNSSSVSTSFHFRVQCTFAFLSTCRLLFFIKDILWCYGESINAAIMPKRAKSLQFPELLPRAIGRQIERETQHVAKSDSKVKESQGFPKVFFRGGGGASSYKLQRETSLSSTWSVKDLAAEARAREQCSRRDLHLCPTQTMNKAQYSTARVL